MGFASARSPNNSCNGVALIRSFAKAQESTPGGMRAENPFRPERESPDLLSPLAPLNLVRTRSTASLTSPRMNGTRWNASLPGLEAGSGAGPRADTEDRGRSAGTVGGGFVGRSEASGVSWLRRGGGEAACGPTEAGGPPGTAATARSQRHRTRRRHDAEESEARPHRLEARNRVQLWPRASLRNRLCCHRRPRELWRRPGRSRCRGVDRCRFPATLQSLIPAICF